MATAHVLLICGLPGSGKSFMARKLKEENQRASLFDQIVHIEYDSVTRELIQQQPTEESNIQRPFTDESLQAWRSSRKVALNRLDQELENHFQSDTTSTLLVIMDDNLYLRSMRKNIYAICQTHTNERLYFCILWLDVPINICLERNRQRTGNARVPDDIIQNMSMEPPDPIKASWEQGWIHCSNVNDISLDIVVKESHVVLPPPPPVDIEGLERERQRTRESLLHTYDGYLRSWVGAVAQVRRSNAGKANAVRKGILQRLKTEQHDAVNESLVMGWFLEQVCGNDWTEEEIQQLKSATNKKSHSLE